MTVRTAVGAADDDREPTFITGGSFTGPLLIGDWSSTPSTAASLIRSTTEAGEAQNFYDRHVTRVVDRAFPPTPGHVPSVRRRGQPVSPRGGVAWVAAPAVPAGCRRRTVVVAFLAGFALAVLLSH